MSPYCCRPSYPTTDDLLAQSSRDGRFSPPRRSSNRSRSMSSNVSRTPACIHTHNNEHRSGARRLSFGLSATTAYCVTFCFCFEEVIDDVETPAWQSSLVFTINTGILVARHRDTKHSSSSGLADQARHLCIHGTYRWLGGEITVKGTCCSA